MDKIEATTALEDIEASQHRTRARAEHKGADVIYVIWGIIWCVAFTTQHFGKGFSLQIGSSSISGANVVWLPLVLIGIVITLVIARRHGAVKDPDGYKFGLLWPIIFGYYYLWLFLMGPLFDHTKIQSEEGILHATAVVSTIPMLIYVLTGLMTGSAYIAWIGGAVTVLTAVGLYFFHDYFYLWMAVVGGGGLLLAGYISRRKWQSL